MSPDSPGADAPGADAPGADAPGADAPGADAPGAETATVTEEPPTPAMLQTIAPHALRRPTKFMAELSRAMQAAVETSRDETVTRLAADAKHAVEEIHAASAIEAAELRRRADDDVAGVREWSKAEIARVREETEARIGLRKGGLDAEVAAHEAVVEARVKGVGDTVAGFEALVAAFFERMRTEEDPTRIAAMAEAMPEPPDLAGVAAAISEPTVALFEPAPIAGPAIEVDLPDVPNAPGPDVSSGADFAAAEAEAATFTGDVEDESVAATTTQAAQAAQADANESTASQLAASAEETPLQVERMTTRVVVVGLVSVASIATFKRSLGRVPGVSAIGVASGPDGEFVFTVSHDAGIGLGEAISALPGFGAQVTASTDDSLEVAAHDPDAGA